MSSTVVYIAAVIAALAITTAAAGLVVFARLGLKGQAISLPVAILLAALTVVVALSAALVVAAVLMMGVIGGVEDFLVVSARPGLKGAAISLAINLSVTISCAVVAAFLMTAARNFGG